MSISTLVNSVITNGTLANKVIAYINTAITDGVYTEDKLMENPILYITSAVNAVTTSKIYVSEVDANNDPTLRNNKNVVVLTNPIGHEITIDDRNYIYDGKRFNKVITDIKSSTYVNKISQCNIALDAIKAKDYGSGK